MGKGREKEVGMSGRVKREPWVGSGSKEELEKLLYHGRRTKVRRWPLASVGRRACWRR